MSTPHSSIEDLPVPTDPQLAAQMQRVVAASQYFRLQCRQRPEILSALLDSGDLGRSFDDNEIRDELIIALQDCTESDDLDRRLRLFRQRQMMRIIWRDFNRLSPTMETTRDISLLAEACIELTRDWWHEQLVQQFGEPQDPDGQAQQLVVLGMGKLGARELNLSSDIDLIFAYPTAGQTVGGPRALDNQDFFIRLGQRLIAALDKVTPEGFVFRVDMRLRPYGNSGALVFSFAAMEDYYQEQGRDWERYALIKAHPICGGSAAGELMHKLQPFVFRRYLDFGAIESLRGMKESINAAVRRGGLEGDVKRGPGGIREVEFIAQCLQLIRGGQIPALQQRELLNVLDALVEEDCLPADAARELRAAYLFLRDTEHAIQGYEDKQSQELPGSDEARAALLRAMDFETWDSFMDKLDGYRKQVSHHFADLIAPTDEPDPEAGYTQIWPEKLSATPLLELDFADLQASIEAAVKTEARLGELGFADPSQVADALVKLRESSLMKAIQAEGRERLNRFMPLLLQACLQQQNPDEVFLRLLHLVEAIARRSAYLVLLLENPPALKELASLCAASPWISAQLARHPVLLDELLDPRSLYSTPDKQQLRALLDERLSRLQPEDLEANMDALRYFKESEVLHIAASEVTGRLPLMKVSDNLTFLAEVIVEATLKLAWLELAHKHGEPPRDEADATKTFPDGTDFIVLGYGKLGGLEMAYGSDLDLVFVYDASAKGATDGERPIDTGVFYTRLAQRMIHILNSQTALGRLYPVDLRLRPSGDSGVLVTTFAGLLEYQLEHAWSWEHQALVRARVIVGDAVLGQHCDELRRQVLSKARDTDTLRREVVEMRERMREHLLPKEVKRSGLFHLKHGEGGIVDIEFIVQYAVLVYCHQHPSLADWSDNVRILETLGREGLFKAQEVEELTAAYIALRLAVHLRDLQQQPVAVEAGQFDKERRAVISKWQALLGE
ncbi:MAG: bifunctional [glutamate--ammonia ligase]-adenylyl-L-tyrosine phosphorylase/[glutamate--ammonia-ligase] adenylyltransferase [Gammaproteobacteria bacterium]